MPPKPMSDTATAEPVPELIVGIPVRVTRHHNYQPFWWNAQGITDAHLLMIGSDPSVADHILANDKRNWQLSKGMPVFGTPAYDISNVLVTHDSQADLRRYVSEDVQPGSVLCAAAHYGLVSRALWYDPATGILVDLNQDPSTSARRALATEVQAVGGSRYGIQWVGPLAEYVDHTAKGKVVDPVQAHIAHPFVLDIDLGSLCTDLGEAPEDLMHERVDRNEYLLRKLGTRPDMITITRNQGKPYLDRGFIGGRIHSDEIADHVQKEVVESLNRVYGK